MYIMTNLYIFVLSFIGFIYAFEHLTPSCSTCKFFIPNPSHPDLGLCEMFQDTVYNGNKRHRVKNFAVHCRNSEHLCGKAGHMYERKQATDDNQFQEKFTIHNNHNNHNNNHNYNHNDNNGSKQDSTYKCSRIKDLFFDDKTPATVQEELEKDMLDVLQKMRRHNTNRLYFTAKELYRFLRK